MNLGSYMRTIYVEPVKVDETAPVEQVPQAPVVPAQASRDNVTVETPEPVSA